MKPDSGIRIVALNRPEDRERWNAFVAGSAFGHVMQMWEWADFKSRSGWTSSRLAVEENGRLVAGSQVLFRKLPIVPYSLAYVPKGPVAEIQDRDRIAGLMAALHDAARREHALFLKIEPDFLNAREARERLAELGFRHVRLTNQPRCTFILDLAADEQTLLQKMDRNARRLIHRAEEQGVTIDPGNREGLDDFYEVIRATAEEKKLPLRPKSFYVEAFDALGPTGVQLFLARHGGTVVGGLFVVVSVRTSCHLWAGSSPEGRKLSAAYPLHWAAIRWAKEQGFAQTDLWGIPDEIAGLVEENAPVPADKDEGLWGVYRFKKGFGGRIRCYVGAYDHVYHRQIYRLVAWATRKQSSMDEVSVRIERLIGKRR